MTGTVGITVYGCEPDEADTFLELSPRFGIEPTIVGDELSERRVRSESSTRCISVGHKTPLSFAVLRALKETGVEYVSTRSIGFDHIDLDGAAQLGIIVDNVLYAPDGVADYALMLILMAIRDAKEIVTAAERRDYRLGRVRGRDLRDLTVGVVGVGNIGEAVIRRLHGFGCRVLACNNDPRPAVAADFVSLPRLLRESDVVTLHLPLTAETHHCIGRRQIAAMKRSAILVNTGRGALVDTDALITALERGELGGAALDVIEDEHGIFYVDCTTTPVDNRRLLRLQEMPNVIVTPHTAYYTRRALHDTVRQTLVKCLRFERRRENEATHDRDLVRGLLGGA